MDLVEGSSLRVDMGPQCSSVPYPKIRESLLLLMEVTNLAPP